MIIETNGGSKLSFSKTFTKKPRLRPRSCASGSSVTISSTRARLRSTV